MSHIKKHEEALQLRREGKSYSQIKKNLGVSKSTLSGWLHNFPLTKSQLELLGPKSEIRIEHYRATRKIQREQVFQESYMSEQLKILPLSKRDIFIAGLMLYWGEGTKCTPSSVSFANTDPAAVKMFLKWIIECYRANKNDVWVRLHLYKDMNIGKEITFWSGRLALPKTRFKKPYIKDSSLQRITYKGGFGHGTCNILIYNAILTRRVMSGLKVMRDYFDPLEK